MFRFFFNARWLGIVSILTAFVLLASGHESLSAQSSSNRFYYYQGTRIPLRVNPNLIAVRFEQSVDLELQQRIVAATGDIENFDARVESPVGALVIMPLRAGRDPLAAVARIQARVGVQFASPLYDFDATQIAETDEFLARFPSDLSPSEVAQINRDRAVSVVRAQPHSERVMILKPNAGNPRSARELANAYVESGVVEFAEPNFVIRQTRPRSVSPQAAESGELAPNDTNFSLEWALKNTRQFQGALQGADIKAANAWNVTQGASTIKIAVIDEGVDSAHPELAGKLLTGYNALNGSSNTNPKTNDHHGTGIAGVAAANSNNGAGIAGVCWFCQILPVKVAETDSQGNWMTSTATLASGIDWAWQHGADVLNNSWTMTLPSDDVQLSIFNARFAGRSGKGSTIVFAAGNQDASAVAFPASLNSYVIAVGASNWCDQRKTPTNDLCNNSNGSWGSNYGTALDLVAPGEALFTTCNGNQCSNGAYTYLSGTSLSAPLVSGAAALLYSLNPNLTPDKVQQVLQKGAQDIGAPGREDETGSGRLDVFRAIAALYNLKLNVTDNKFFVRPGETVAYTLSYANTGSTAMGGTNIYVTLPANTTYVSSSPAFTAQGGGVYKLSIATLASNSTGSATFRVQVQPSAAGQVITFDASISGAFPEFNTADNSASDTSIGVKRGIFLPFIERNAP